MFVGGSSKLGMMPGGGRPAGVFARYCNSCGVSSERLDRV